MDYLQPIEMPQFRQLIAALRDVRDVDLSDYAISPLKHRFERVMQIHGYLSVEKLIEKITHDEVFADICLKEIATPVTEMFRDPQMWRELEYILSRQDNEGNIKIWVPEVCGDEELYSLMILLQRTKLLQRSVVYATCGSKRVLDVVQRGAVEIRKMETNQANFARMDEKGDLNHYFTRADKFDIFSVDLLAPVVFLRHDLFRKPPPDKAFDIILFRNKMVNYSLRLKSIAVEIMTESLAPGGYFIIGIGENLDNCDKRNYFKPESRTENIFKKISVI